MITTRFAPSPTGALHLGHVYAAWQAWRAAGIAGGRYLVRLEDIDAARCTADLALALLDDLAWVGLASDQPVRVQSAHLPDYAAVLAGLRARRLIYPCFCSRADIMREIAASGGAPHAPDGAAVYPATCRSLGPNEAADRIAAGAPHAWRLNMRAACAEAGRLHYTDTGPDGRPIHVACNPAAFGDIVLARRDAPCSYHLCVTHDDAAQGVTLVTRGDDLRAATDVHRLLQQLMGWAAPAYAHHRLLLGADGARLSKRDGAAGVAVLREGGATPAEIWRLAGCAHEPL